MSTLNSLYIKKEALETLLQVVNKKGEKGVELTIAINDEFNQYGQNISSWVSQTKDQREAKKPRYFVGNGKQFWPKVESTPKWEPPVAGQVEEDEDLDLPF